VTPAPKTLVIFAPTWPESNKTAAGVRSYQFCRWLLDADWTVHFMSAAKASDAKLAIEGLGVTTHQIELNNTELLQKLISLSPSHVLFERYRMEEAFSWMVHTACPNAIRIVDTVDFHALRECREQAVTDEINPTASLSDLLARRPTADSDALQRELASIHRSDKVWVVSSAEKSILENEYSIQPAKTNCIELARDHLASPKPFESRKHFVSIGNFRHAPNLDAFRRLRDDLWPRIHVHLPKAELHVYGAFPPAEVMKTDIPGLVSKGQAKDALETLGKYRISLAPLWFGAGQKGKLLDSIASGTLPITTPIGAEGMQIADACVGLDTDSFVTKAVAMYSDETAWQDALSGCCIPNETEVAGQVQTEMEQVATELEQLRASNVIGGILFREQLRSTEYFSRWIAEKNRFNQS